MNKPDINVTPLIDVLLVLLIIFMIVSPLKPSQIETKIPTSDSNLGTAAEPVVVSIDKSSDLFIDGVEVESSIEDLSGLISRLKTILDSKNIIVSDSEQQRYQRIPQTMVFVQAPQSLKYGSVIKVIDAVKMGGGDPVGLQLE